MNSSLTFILAMSCSIPALIGVIIYKRVDPKFYPFIYAMWLAFAVEALFKLGLYLSPDFVPAIVYNIYIPVNLFLYLQFFYYNGIIKKQKHLMLLMVASLLLWVGLLTYQKTLLIVPMFAQVFNAAVIVIASIELLSKQVLYNRQSPFKSFFFLLACGCILQYLFFVFSTTIMQLGTGYGNLKGQVFTIYQYINAGAYLLFAYALLCLPKIKTYTP